MTQSNQEFFGSIYNELAKITKETKSTIKLSEFKKFEVLFRKTDEPVPSRGSARFQEFQALSEEYSKRVNIWDNVHVIDDITGEVIVTLPPMYKQPNILTPKEVMKNANFAQESNHDFPGASDRAHLKLQASFVSSQNLDPVALQKTRKIIGKMSEEAMNKVGGNATTKVENTKSDGDINLEFELD